MSQRTTLARITEPDGTTYLTIVKILVLKRYRSVSRKCIVKDCEEESGRNSSFCFDCWYDFEHNPSKLKASNGVWIRLKKKRKKNRRKKGKNDVE